MNPNPYHIRRFLLRIFYPAIRWLLKSKIEYILYHCDGCVDNADIKRDGEPATYWKGKFDGFQVGISILLNTSFNKYGLTAQRKMIVASEKLEIK